MIKVSDLLDLNKLGKMELVEVRPTYAYVDEKRTDTISGYSYCVVLTDHNYEKIYVRIPGAQQVENPSKAVRVHFEGLQASVYVHGNWPRLAFKALKAIAENRLGEVTDSMVMSGYR